MTDTVSSVSVAPTAAGCLIRVEGRGTVRESRVVKDIAARTLRDGPTTNVAIDLADCAYVDSTFLGTLMELYRTAGPGQRFAIAGPAAQRSKLLGMARLDKLIAGMDFPPDTLGNFVAVPATDASPREILRHVMECHFQLAQIDCPMSNIFAKIATQMKKELEASD